MCMYLKTDKLWLLIEGGIHCVSQIYFLYPIEIRGGAIGSGTALQVGRSRVRFPMVSLEFFLPASLWPWGRLSQEYKRRPARMPDNLTTFMCQARLSWNLGASTWNPQDLYLTIEWAPKFSHVTRVTPVCCSSGPLSAFNGDTCATDICTIS
jgi:hypothetical protein